MVPEHFDWAIKQLATDYKTGYERLVLCFAIRKDCQLTKDLPQIQNPNVLLHPSIMQDAMDYKTTKGRKKKKLLDKIKGIPGQAFNLAHEYILNLPDEKYMQTKISLFKHMMVLREAEYPNHPSTANTYRILIAKPLTQLEQYEEALHYFQKALTIYQKTPTPESHASQIEILDQIGEVLTLQNKFKEANEAFLKALSLGPNEGTKHYLYQRMGYLALKTETYDLALEHFQQALTVCETIKVDPRAHTANLSCVGDIYRIQGNAKESLISYKKALKQIEPIAGTEEIKATIINNIGTLHLDQSNLDQALEHYQQALKIYEAHPCDPQKKANTICNIGSVLRLQGNLQQALKQHQKALAIQELFDKSGKDIADSHIKIGYILYDLKQLSDAEASLKKGLDTLPVYAKRGLLAADAMGYLGNICNEQKNHKEAFEYHEKTLEICKLIAPQDTRTASAYINLGNSYRFLGRALDALECYQKVTTHPLLVKKCKKIQEST